MNKGPAGFREHVRRYRELEGEEGIKYLIQNVHEIRRVEYLKRLNEISDLELVDVQCVGFQVQLRYKAITHDDKFYDHLKERLEDEEIGNEFNFLRRGKLKENGNGFRRVHLIYYGSRLNIILDVVKAGVIKNN
ncbi:MAG: hypothetical protein AABX30_03650 [Nanoarchaeota archaeon]